METKFYLPVLERQVSQHHRCAFADYQLFDITGRSLPGNK